MQNFTEDLLRTSITVSAPPRPFLGKVVTSGKQIVLRLIQVCKFLLSWMAKPENWLKKRTWIGALALLRAAYVVMNEYGKNPFKKSL